MELMGKKTGNFFLHFYSTQKIAVPGLHQRTRWGPSDPDLASAEEVPSGADIRVSRWPSWTSGPVRQGAGRVRPSACRRWRDIRWSESRWRHSRRLRCSRRPTVERGCPRSCSNRNLNQIIKCRYTCNDDRPILVYFRFSVQWIILKTNSHRWK